MRTKHILRAALLIVAFSASTASMVAQTLRSAYFLDGYYYRHELNPAFAPERNYIAFPVLGNLNVSTQSNIGVSNLLYKLPNGNLTTFMNESVTSSEFLGGLKSHNKINVDLFISVLSAGFRAWGGYNTFELNVRSNTSLNLPYELFEFAKLGMTSDETEYSFDKLGIKSNSYLELAFGHSRPINDKLTLGAKVKFLLGIYGANFNVKNMRMLMSGDKWLISGNGEFHTGGFVDIPTKMRSYQRTEDGVTENIEHEVLDFENIDTGDKFLNGFGMAFDFGGTYQLRDYLQLSASLVDLGWISYNNTTRATVLDGGWEFDGFTEIPFESDKANENGQTSIEDQWDNFGNDLEDFFQLEYQETKRHAIPLGATLTLGALYTFHYYDKLKFGGLLTTRIEGSYSWCEFRLSANVAPVKCFDASLSYAISSFGSSLGWMLNYHGSGFNLFIGTNHQFFKITPQFVPVSKANTSVSFGITFPFGKLCRNQE